MLGGLTGWKGTTNNIQSSYAFPLYGWEKKDHFYTALFGYNRNSTYYTPLIGRYTGNQSGSWILPLYQYKKTKANAVDLSYLLLGQYKKDDYSKKYGFAPVFKYSQRDYTVDPEQKIQVKSKRLKYLLLGNYEKQEFKTEYGFLPFFYYNQKSYDGGNKEAPVKTESQHISYLLIGQKTEIRNSYTSVDGGTNTPVSCKKESKIFPIWSHATNEDFLTGKQDEKCAWLGILYDTLHEKESGEKKNDYFRQRVLWRLYHKETLNGDSSTDIFPAITIDSRQDGYLKYSILWRLLRYEKNADGAPPKLDVLFIPIRR